MGYLNSRDPDKKAEDWVLRKERNQWINQTINTSVNQTVGQSINHLTTTNQAEPTNQSIYLILFQEWSPEARWRFSEEIMSCKRKSQQGRAGTSVMGQNRCFLGSEEGRNLPWEVCGWRRRSGPLIGWSCSHGSWAVGCFRPHYSEGWVFSTVIEGSP